MRLALILGCFFACDFSALSQDDAMVSGIRDLPLAIQARVQGDVVVSGGKIVRGHPLLVPAAMENAKSLKLADPGAEVIYHFILVDAVKVTRATTIKKGDAFDRAILRALRIKTEKVVQIDDCIANPNPPKNRIDLTRTPVEVWVYGTIWCLETLNYMLASR